MVASATLHSSITVAGATILPSASAGTTTNKLCRYPRRQKHFGAISTRNQKRSVLKWTSNVSLFPFFPSMANNQAREEAKEELFEAIAPLDRGANASLQDQALVDKIAHKLEAMNQVKEPLKSSLLDGKWELVYTTSQAILGTQLCTAYTRLTDSCILMLCLRPPFLRPFGKIYQAINVDTLRAQNIETWPFFNQITANLVPLNARKVAVKFDYFKIGGLLPIKNPGSGRGQLEITYLDDELRISRGNRGNLFILRIVDRSYRVPL